MVTSPYSRILHHVIELLLTVASRYRGSLIFTCRKAHRKTRDLETWRKGFRLGREINFSLKGPNRLRGPLIVCPHWKLFRQELRGRHVNDTTDLHLNWSYECVQIVLNYPEWCHGECRYNFSHIPTITNMMTIQEVAASCWQIYSCKSVSSKRKCGNGSLSRMLWLV